MIICDLILIGLKDAVPLDSKLKMKHRRVHILVLNPASIKQRLLKTLITFANEYFGLLV